MYLPERHFTNYVRFLYEMKKSKQNNAKTFQVKCSYCCQFEPYTIAALVFHHHQGKFPGNKQQQQQQESGWKKFKCGEYDGREKNEITNSWAKVLWYFVWMCECVGFCSCCCFCDSLLAAAQHLNNVHKVILSIRSKTKPTMEGKSTATSTGTQKTQNNGHWSGKKPT